MDAVLLFLQEHFLHWVEVMSLLSLISEVVGVLNLLRTATQVSSGGSIYSNLYDGYYRLVIIRQYPNSFMMVCALSSSIAR